MERVDHRSNTMHDYYRYRERESESVYMEVSLHERRERVRDYRWFDAQENERIYQIECVGGQYSDGCQHVVINRPQKSWNRCPSFKAEEDMISDQTGI